MTQGRMISFLLLLIVQFCTAPIHPQHRTIPIASGEHGNLFFGDPFEQNDAAQLQSPINESSQDKVALSEDFSQELHVELPSNHISQPQAIRTLLTNEDIESLSSDQYHPLYTLIQWVVLMCSAEIHQNIVDPEAHQQEISSTLSQVPVAIDADIESIDMDLGTLLACGDLGPLSVDEINVEPLLSDNEIEISLNDTFQVRNASMTSANHRHNSSELHAHQHVPAFSFDSAGRKIQNAGEQRDKNVVPVAIDADTESIDMDLGTLLAFGNLGPLSVDGINIEQLLSDNEIQTSLNDAFQVRNASMTSANHRHNSSELHAHQQVPAASFDSADRKVDDVDKQRDKIMVCSGSSVSACRQLNRSARINSSESFSQSDFSGSYFINQTAQKSFNASSDYHKLHIDEKPFKCDVCPKQFRTSSSYRKHRRIHTGEKPFKCDFCQKEFTDSSSYQRHRLIHTGEKPYQCDICAKQFRTSSDYKKHRRIHTGEKPYQCDICAKQFRTSTDYQKHRRIHTGEKPYQCDICAKQFRTSSDYQEHRRKHTGEKPFKCDVCPKRFQTPGQFQKHRRIHTGEKPYQCDICSKQFHSSSDYHKHRRIHTGERPYQCDICTKQFRTSKDYQTHRRMHTGEKPFKCDICQKEFSDSSNYQRHRQTHAGHKSHICCWCNQDYCSRYSLIKHVRKCSSRNASRTADPAVSCTITTDTGKWTYMQ